MTNNNDYDSIKCPVCLHTFDADKRVPKIFPTCGHTICKECLVQVLQMDRPQCPLDKLRFGSEYRNIEAFPTNFLGKDLLEIEGAWSKCPVHNEQKKIICFTDNTLICSSCVIFGEHKCHDIKPFSDYVETAKSKKRQLSTMSDKISKASSKLLSTLEDNKQKMKIALKERFDNLKASISKQETRILSKLETVFMEERIKLQNMANNESSDLFELVNNKLTNFSNIMSNPGIVKMVEEDFTDLEKSVNEKLTLSTNKLNEELSELMTLLESHLPNENTLKEFDVIAPLTQKLSEYNLQRNFNFEDQAKHLKEVVIPSVELTISLKPNDQLLTIEESSSAKSYTFDRLKLEQIQHVQYSFITEEHADDKIIPALIWITKFLPNVKSVKFTFSYSSRSFPEKRVYSLLSATLSKPENLESIEIYSSKAPVSDLGLIFLAEKVLPRIKNLKAFDCTLFKTKITGQVLQAFAQANLAAQPNLEKFRMNVTGADLKEEDMIQFLKTVPNVKDLLLGFGETELTDQALEVFSTEILPNLNKIERIELGFQHTKVSGSGIQKFLMNLPTNVKTLWIGMNDLKITDAEVKSFLDEKLPSFTELEDLKLGLSGTQVSEKIIEQVYQWREKVMRRNEVSEQEFPFVRTQVLSL